MSRKINILILALVVIIMFGVRQVNADFTFGTPKNLGPTINSSHQETSACTSADGLSIVFWRAATFDEPGEFWLSTRSSSSVPWDAPINYGPWPESLNLPIENVLSWFTADGLETPSGEKRTGGYGNLDLWMYQREAADDDWGQPVNLGPVVNSTHDDSWPSISRDGLELYFMSYNRLGGYGNWDLWVTRRANRDAPWTEPENLGPMVNSGVLDKRPCLSPDGLILFFDSKRSGGYGSSDLYMTSRPSRSDPWGEAVNLGPVVNSSSYEEVAYISADGSTIYFDSDRSGGYGGHDIWQVSIEPIVDLNGDGIVDAADMCIIVDNWGTDDPLCDIGPSPFGDGIVDVQDLIVLAEHLFEEISPVE